MFAAAGAAVRGLLTLMDNERRWYGRHLDLIDAPSIWLSKISVCRAGKFAHDNGSVDDNDGRGARPRYGLHYL